MTGREKLAKALAHEEAPLLIDFGGTMCSGMHVSIVEKLREFYGLEKRPVKMIEPMQMLGEIDDELREVLGVQTRAVAGPINNFGFRQDEYKEYTAPWGQTMLVPVDFNYDIDAKGDTYLYPQGNRNYKACARMPAKGYFFDALERAPEFDEDDYDWHDNVEEFGPVNEDMLQHITKLNDLYKDSTDAIVGSLGGTGLGDIAFIPGPGLLEPKGIRTVEEWYISTVARTEEVHKIFDYEIEIGIQNLEKLHEILGDTIQVAFTCGTDLGTQNGPFCSVEQFRDLYAPYYKKVNNWIHDNTNWKTFKHCCGSMIPLIPEFIDCGFDCLNPVQWTAKGMDPEMLKREFGKYLTFWGGGVDTQKTLPYGTPEQVYEETKRCCEIFGKGGGYVFNTIHNVQALTPAENLDAMFRAVHDYNEGR